MDEIDGKICGRKKFKFAFQFSENGDPWWLEGNPSSPTDLEAFTFFVNRCSKCSVQSPQVYQRWLCLNSKCDDFFVNSPEEYSSLEMRNDFLSLRSESVIKGKGRWDLQYKNKKNKPSLWYSARGQWCERCKQLCVRYVALHLAF